MSSRTSSKVRVRSKLAEREYLIKIYFRHSSTNLPAIVLSFHATGDAMARQIAEAFVTQSQCMVELCDKDQLVESWVV
jgi:ribosomal protein RSM22 (predicted rRNA methylase)